MLLLGTALAALPDAPAAAHLVGPGHPLAAVLRHPAFEPLHAAAMLALGLSAGQQAPRAGWIMLGAFALATAGGAVAAGQEFLPPLRAPAVAATLIVFGALAALHQRLPWWAGAMLAGTAGVYQGALGTLAHWQGGTGPYPASEIVVAALLLPMLALQFERRLRVGWLKIALRVVGSWIAASGILLLALLLRLR